MRKATLQAAIKELRKTKQECKTLDAKRELVLHENGDKAEFVKDVIAMANNGELSYMVIGLEDKTYADVGPLAYHYDKNTINQILLNKIDPPVVVDYREFAFGGKEYALIEINGTNPPYIVAQDIVHAKTDRKQTRVYRGMIFVRHEDRTAGISRSELDELFRAKRPDVKVSFEKDLTKKRVPQNHLPLIFYIHNQSEIMAQNVEVLMAFEGCNLLKCPDFEHNHLGNHYGEYYEDKTLVVSLPHLLGKSVSTIMRFTLIRGDDKLESIGVLIRGGNLEERETSIDLSEIDEQHRLW